MQEWRDWGHYRASRDRDRSSVIAFAAQFAAAHRKPATDGALAGVRAALETHALVSTNCVALDRGTDSIPRPDPEDRLTRTEALRTAKAALAPDADDCDIILEALRLLGIDVDGEEQGRRIDEYIRTATIIDGPETFLRWHVLTAGETPDGRARFHF